MDASWPLRVRASRSASRCVAYGPSSMPSRALKYHHPFITNTLSERNQWQGRSYLLQAYINQAWQLYQL